MTEPIHLTPELRTRPQPIEETEDARCEDRVACDGVILEPLRRKGKRCKACMDHRMKERARPISKLDAMTPVGARPTSRDRLQASRARGGAVTAAARSKRVEDEDLPTRSGYLERIGGTVMMALPARGIFREVPCVPMRCTYDGCSSEIHIPRAALTRSKNRPRSCEPCKARRRQVAERDRIAREREEAAARQRKGRAAK